MALATGSVSADNMLSAGIPTDPVSEILNGNRKLAEKMAIAVSENPELREAVLRFEQMQRRSREALDAGFAGEA